MFVSHLSLADFRNWKRADLALLPGPSVLVGANGQGKTNLLEALVYLSSLGSHRVSSDAPLIRSGCDQAQIQAAVVSEDRQLVLEIAIIAGRPNRAKVNRAPIARPRDLLGGLRTVLFAPEDLSIVRGDPAERRRFLDDLLVQRLPRLAGVRGDYERVLKQRGALLKTAGGARRFGGSEDLRTLDVWDAQLAGLGAELLAARLALVADLEPYLSDSYRRLAPARGDLRTQYQSSVVAAAVGEASTDTPDLAALSAAMIAELTRLRRQELDRGVTLTGPHRDERELSINDLALRGYASHGEGWTAALALRLASYELLSGEGAEPVLILDDVFAELDGARRDHLAQIASKAEQVLISTAVGSDVPEALAGPRFVVENGEVSVV